MADKKTVNQGDQGELMIARAKDFWERNSKVISIVFVIVIWVSADILFITIIFKNPKKKKRLMYPTKQKNITAWIQ